MLRVILFFIIFLSPLLAYADLYKMNPFTGKQDNVFGAPDIVDKSGNIGIGTSNPQFKLQVNGGGIAGEMVNKGYELIMPQPSGLNTSGSSGCQNEAQGFEQFRNNLYIGYETNGCGSSIYKWDGNTESLFYTFGNGTNGTSSFGGISTIQEYNGKLYAGNQSNTAHNGTVYVYDPSLTPSNFVQTTSAFSTTTSSITIPNDSSNNAIFGATSYSVEYYGRIDDLGQGNSGNIIRKYDASASKGFNMDIGANNHIDVNIHEGASNKITTTNNGVFTLGNLHDIAFSWTSGSNPIIYVDGVAVGLSVSNAVTTPTDDTSVGIILGNTIANTRSFGGTFRRLRIWRNYAITSGDASTLASGGTIATPPTGQYLFTEGSGTTTADSSGNNNTATIVSPAFWNTTLFDVAYSSGTDFFMYALIVYKGKLYAGAGYITSNIYSYDGTTWTKVYSGLAGSGLVVSFYVYKGLLFAALGGSTNAAILSTPDGINWTVEATVPNATATEFNKFVEYKGNLYVGMIKGASGTNDIYKRADTGGTWAVEIPSISAGQVWGMNVYNDVFYAGATTSGGATIYKSYDGFNFISDFQIPNVNRTEVFSMFNYNGSLYLGIGFNTNASADIWRKTDSVGQQTDWINKFLNHFYGNTQNGYNWTNDLSLTTYSSPWVFNSNVGIGLNNGNGANSALDIVGGVTIGTANSSNYTNITAPSGGVLIEGNVGIGSTNPGSQLDVNGTTRTTNLTIAGIASGTQCLQANASGVISGTGGVCGGGGTPGGSSGQLQWNNSSSFAGVSGSGVDSNGNIGIGSPTPGQILDVQGTVRSTALDIEGNTYISGNLGIGTTNPTAINANYKAGLYGSTNGARTIFVYNPNAGTSAQSRFELKTADTNGETIQYPTNGSVANWAGRTVLLNETGNGIAIASGSGNLDFLTSSTTRRMRIDTTGNVGIGTITPANLLDVKGSMSIGTYGGITSGPSNSLIVSGNIGIGSSNPGKTLDITGTVRASSLTSGGTQCLQAGTDGTVSGTGAVCGGSGSSGANPSASVGLSAVNGAAVTFLRSDGAPSLDQTIAPTWTGQHTFNASPIAFITGSGNVGIGSPTPGQILDVSGTARATAFSLNGSGAGTLFSPNGFQFDPNNTTGTGISSKLNIQTNGNVGINSTAPGQTLDVQGSVRLTGLVMSSSGSNGQVLTRDGGGGGYWATPSAGGSGTVNSGTSGQAAYYASSTTAVSGTNNIIINGSNVGIGSATPGQVLDVQGSLRVLSGTIDVESTPGTRDIIDAGGNIGIGTSSGTVTKLFVVKGPSNFSVDNAGTTTIAGTTIGNGNGVTVSSATANFVGSSSTAGSFTLYRGGSSTTSQAFLRSTSANGTTDSIVLQVGNNGAAEGLRIQDNSGVANVGIGSASPGQKLDVQGSIRVIGPSATFITKQTTAPTVANNDCGTTVQGTIVANSSDLSGTVTAGTLAVTSCAVTFNGTFTAAPNCICMDDTNVLGVRCTATTTKLTITSASSMSGDNVTWWCPANS